MYGLLFYRTKNSEGKKIAGIIPGRIIGEDRNFHDTYESY